MKKRTLVITRPDSGRQLAAVLRDHFHLGWSEVRQLVRNQHVLLDGKICPKSSVCLRKGQTLEITGPIETKKSSSRPRKKSDHFFVDETLPKPIIRYVDKHIVVVDKPAGLTTVRHRHEAEEFGPRGRKYLPPTLADILPAMLAKGQTEKLSRVRAVHRLDKDTSGLIVFARTAEAESELGKQLRKTKVERKYWALVRGQAKSERIESYLAADRGDGRRGSTEKPGEGKRAVTHVRVLEQFADLALVECHLETGRTHQVRIHLGERGTPLCGERLYDRPLHGKSLQDPSGAERTLLHARYLSIEHPITHKRMSWTSYLPPDMKMILDQLCGKSRSEKEKPISRKKSRGKRRNSKPESLGNS